MVIKVGINGFGRIGRIMFRTCFQNSDIEVSAINDPAIDVEYFCYLIKFDSVHGNFNGEVACFKDDIKINGNLIKIFHSKQPSAVPWQSVGVQYVIESSGMFTSYEKAVGHLSVEGVRRVVVTAPSIDVPMIIMGVNDDKLYTEHKVISCASSTLYCLAPIMKVLQNNFGVSEGFVTSIHAMTPSLKPLDGLCLRGKHWRDYRSIHQNIIPAMTGACKALGKIIPELKDKLAGLAFRVPIVNVSVLDLTIRLNRDTTLQNIVQCVENASKTYLKGVLDISNKEAVSSDFIRDSHSCILDVNSSMQLKPNFYKLICWYENEFSYACRVVDLINLSERQSCQTLFIEGGKVASEVMKEQLKMEKLSVDVLTNESLGCVRQFKTISNDYRPKTLPNVRRKLSKNFKIKTIYSPVHDMEPSSARISLISQGAILNCNSESKSDIYKITSKDNNTITDQAIAGHSKKSFLEICPKLHKIQNVKRELNKMIIGTEKLLRKLQKIYVRSSCKYQVKKKNCKESGVTRSDTNNVRISTVGTENYIKCQTSNSFECTRFLINEYNGRIVSNEYQKCICPERDTTGNQNFETGNFENVDKNVICDVEFTESIKDILDCVEINKNYINNLYDESIILNTGDFVPKRAVMELKQDTIYHDSEKLNTNERNEISEEGLKEEQIHSQNLDVSISRLENIILSKDDIDIANPLKNGHTENITGYIIFGETDEIKNKSKILRQRVTSKQNFLVQKRIICKSLTLHSSQKNSSLRDVNKIKTDIYDKLDSTSAIISDNSFHVNEKQSQVIYISDITNSLEDLPRLEKICKIIEISDDLSDQLFSRLSASDHAHFKNKKWSFRDLCRKIKLDDFYDKVCPE